MDNSRVSRWLLTFLCAMMMHNVYGFNLTILHTNDIHSRIEETSKDSSRCTSTKGECYGGQERLKSKIDELRAKFPDSLLLDAGDQFQGTTYFYVYGGQIMSHFMNVLGYDAMALGNHEFDSGPTGLQPFLDNATFPVLSCNIDVSETPELSSVNKSVIKTVSGQKIGIIGYTTTETPLISFPGKVVFEDEVSAIQREADAMKKKGIEIIIGLGHAGYDVDMAIAKKVRGLDVVVGGHTNTFLYTGDNPDKEKPLGPYPTVVKNPDGQNVLVVQDYAYGKYLGFLQVDFNDKGVATAWNGNPILMDNTVPKDPTVTELIKKYRPSVEKAMEEKVGQSLVYLEGHRSVCRVRECNMGNFITDAMVHQNLRNNNQTGWNDVAIALTGGGAIRSSISKGDIMMRDVQEVMPFKNTIDLVQLTGKILWKTLEHSASRWVEKGALFGGFLQMSGLRVVYDMKQKVGRRVIRVDALCTECDVPEFKPLDMEKTYKVLSNSFLIAGGDGYTMIKDNVGDSHILGDVDIDVFLHSLNNDTLLTNGLEGRIQFLQDIKANQYCPGTGSVGKSSFALLMSSLIATAMLYL